MCIHSNLTCKIHEQVQDYSQTFVPLGANANVKACQLMLSHTAA